MINLPIYRAFSETFDKYILGVPYFSDGRYYMLVDDCNKNNNIGSGSYPIDETTLAIHFPDMLDSQGNKIFASLQEDGKGGDILNLNEGCGENFNAIALYRYYEVHLKGGIDLLNRAKYLRCYPKKDIKRIGIQQ